MRKLFDTTFLILNTTNMTSSLSIMCHTNNKIMSNWCLSLSSDISSCVCSFDDLFRCRRLVISNSLVVCCLRGGCLLLHHPCHRQFCTCIFFVFFCSCVCVFFLCCVCVCVFWLFCVSRVRAFTICGSVEWSRQTMSAQGTLCSIAYDWIFVLRSTVVVIASNSINRILYELHRSYSIALHTIWARKLFTD